MDNDSNGNIIIAGKTTDASFISSATSSDPSIFLAYYPNSGLTYTWSNKLNVGINTGIYIRQVKFNIDGSKIIIILSGVSVTVL